MGRKAEPGKTENGHHKVEGTGVGDPFLPPHLPVPCALASSRRWFSLSVFRPPVSDFSLSAFQLFASCLLLGFSIPYSTRSQSSNVRWVCCWLAVISIRCRTKSDQAASQRFFSCDPANLWSGTRTCLRTPVFIHQELQCRMVERDDAATELVRTSVRGDERPVEALSHGCHYVGVGERPGAGDRGIRGDRRPVRGG